uniref:SAP domain-containing protein n=2 Tax=Aplanochytrium stocchinoi TaxID=215587 RepID=A0A7S3LIJ6_9STRA
MTVLNLRYALREHSADPYGNKAALQDRLREILASETKGKKTSKPHIATPHTKRAPSEFAKSSKKRAAPARTPARPLELSDDKLPEHTLNKIGISDDGTYTWDGQPIDELRVIGLKEVLKELSLKPYGLKAELYDRVFHALEKAWRLRSPISLNTRSNLGESFNNVKDDTFENEQENNEILQYTQDEAEEEIKRSPKSKATPDDSGIIEKETETEGETGTEDIETGLSQRSDYDSGENWVRYEGEWVQEKESIAAAEPIHVESKTERVRVEDKVLAVKTVPLLDNKESRLKTKTVQYVSSTLLSAAAANVSILSETKENEETKVKQMYLSSENSLKENSKMPLPRKGPSYLAQSSMMNPSTAVTTLFSSPKMSFKRQRTEPEQINTDDSSLLKKSKSSDSNLCFETETELKNEDTDIKPVAFTETDADVEEESEEDDGFYSAEEDEQEKVDAIEITTINHKPEAENVTNDEDLEQNQADDCFAEPASSKGLDAMRKEENKNSNEDTSDLSSPTAEDWVRSKGKWVKRDSLGSESHDKDDRDLTLESLIRDLSKKGISSEEFEMYNQALLRMVDTSNSDEIGTDADKYESKTMDVDVELKKPTPIKPLEIKKPTPMKYSDVKQSPFAGYFGRNKGPTASVPTPKWRESLLSTFSDSAEKRSLPSTTSKQPSNLRWPIQEPRSSLFLNSRAPERIEKKVSFQQPINNSTLSFKAFHGFDKPKGTPHPHRRNRGDVLLTEMSWKKPKPNVPTFTL